MKLAIIGTGKIVSDALPAIREAGGIDVNAILARPHSLERGNELASLFDIPDVYTDYEELLSEADIDTVYIGLVNSVHYEYARRALEYGRNVILEKPFTVTPDEAEDLLRLAADKDLFIFEAITVLHNGVFKKMKEDLPKLGAIRIMQANFSQYSSRYERYLEGIVDPAFDPERMGGALRDINIYNIHYAAALLGAPKSAHYYPNRGYNGIDTSGVLVMDYGSFKAVCTAAKDSDSPCFVMIQGEHGYMRIDGKPNGADNLTTVIRGAEESTEIYTEEAHHRMAPEFRDFADIIDSRDHKRAGYLGDETLEVMKILHNIRI